MRHEMVVPALLGDNSTTVISPVAEFDGVRERRLDLTIITSKETCHQGFFSPAHRIRFEEGAADRNRKVAVGDWMEGGRCLEDGDVV